MYHHVMVAHTYVSVYILPISPAATDTAATTSRLFNDILCSGCAVIVSVVVVVVVQLQRFESLETFFKSLCDIHLQLFRYSNCHL